MKPLRAQSEVVGALMLIGLIFVSSLTLFVALSYYFAGQSSYSRAMSFEDAFDKQNLSVTWVQALPPSAQSGLAVINYGEPVEIAYLVEERNGSLFFQPENVYLQHGQSATFLTEDRFSGVMTSYGGLFTSGFSEPMIPVSVIGINVTVSFTPQLEYVTPGFYQESSPYPVKWFVNGSYVHAGKSINIYIDGPTSITAVPVYT